MNHWLLALLCRYGLVVEQLSPCLHKEKVVADKLRQVDISGLIKAIDYLHDLHIRQAAGEALDKVNVLPAVD